MTLERRYRIPPARRAKPLVYENLTAEEAEVLTNGCGGKGGWFRPPPYVFTLDCNRHDLEYWIGGTREDRKAADRRFYDRMVERIWKVAWYRWPWLRGAAWRYHTAVRLFGDKYFHRGERRTWWDVERIMQERLDRGQNR